ncbi:MAG: response regulator [Planctomycetes bacterium]|nr:response regulator [Planctomycetota bacterium]
MSTVTVLLVVVGTFGYQAYSRQQWQVLQSELELAGEQLAAGIALAVWNFDNDQIRKIMESKMKDRAVFGLEVRAGDTIYALARGVDWEVDDAPAGGFADTDLLETRRDITLAGQSIGSISVYFTARFLEAQLAQAREVLVVAVLLLDLILILSIYWLIWRRVLRPLKLIEEYSVSVSSGHKQEAVALTQPLVGEFGQLRNSLNKMVELLETQLVEVKELHERVWKMVGGCPIGLSIYCPSTGKIVYVNKKLTDVVGYRLEDVPDVDAWFRLAYPDEAYRREVIAVWIAKVERAIEQNKEVESQDYTVTCKDGSVKTVEIGGVSSGDYIMAVFNDVTDRKKAEEAVQAYQEHLEELVELRTQELVVARDQAEEASKAKSIFLANMSHELRTPLNSVIGFSRMMSTDIDLNPRQQRNLEIIHQSGKHLLTLINDILELSKIEAGKMETTIETLNLHRLLQEVADMLQPRADQAGISLVVETSGLPPAVKGDAAKLRQILLNLVANAIKFTRKGGVVLRAKGILDGNDVAVEFQVTDTGIGIHPQDQQRIFEPFVQVESAGERSGTGLGLSISRQYVQMMGGDIELQSVVGEGSTFRFTLKMPVGEAVSAIAAGDEPRVTGVADRFAGRRVLVADDNPEMRMLLRDLLESLGLQVLEAQNGAQAKEVIASAKPQVVLLDWRMPVLDGIALTKQIRASGDPPQPAIIMLTAHAFDEDRREAIAAGVDDFMSKPIDAEVLYAMIERHTGIHFRRESSAESSKGQNVVQLTTGDLACLSESTKSTFAEALRELNPTRIREALANVRAENSELADRLETQTEAMQYRQLWQVFEINNG